MHDFKEELYDFMESDILFKDKFQNETRLLKGELYKISKFKCCFYVLFNILFLGLPLLFSKWNLRFKLWVLYSKCLCSKAKYIKITDSGTPPTSITPTLLIKNYFSITKESGTVELTDIFEREIEIHGNFDNFKVFFVFLKENK